MTWQAILFTPWNIGAASFGTLFGLLLVFLLVASRRQIGAALVQAAQWLFSPLGFFSVVIVVFLVISVLSSGEFFNVNITHGAVFGLLGYSLALGFDLVSIVCMMARLQAQRMRDERGARLNLVGVSICASVSAFANLCGTLQGYDPVHLDHVPSLLQTLAPWLSVVFPTMIVLLSMTSDHLLDHMPARGIDAVTYRVREQKRVDLLLVRLDTERALLQLEIELATVRHDRELANGKVDREWFFWRWLRPPVDTSETMAHRVVAGPLAPMQTTPEPPVATRVTTDQMAPLCALVGQVSQSSLAPPAGGPGDQAEVMLDQVAPGGGPGDRPEVAQVHHVTRATHGPRPRRTREPVGQSEVVSNQGSTAQALLVALQQTPGLSDRQLAAQLGCSKTTVRRWRKRLVAQGLLRDRVNATL